MAKKEIEQVRLHNRGKREILLKNGIKSVPGRAVTVPEDIAEFYIKAYPRDFILFEDLEATKVAKGNAKKLEAQNAKLAKEKAELEARIAELESEAAAKKDDGKGGESGGGE